MAKARSALADYSVYLVIRFFVCIIQALSFHAAVTLARGLALLAYQVDRRHRLVALENLRLAFPARDPAVQDGLYAVVVVQTEYRGVAGRHGHVLIGIPLPTGIGVELEFSPREDLDIGGISTVIAELAAVALAYAGLLGKPRPQPAAG